jgi:predicted ribosome quality control (RQC) complex YloA/Tae2 family protein
MSIDALTLTAVRDELEPLVVDGRVQKLVFSDEWSMALEVFKPGAGRVEVLLSAHPEHGRVQRIQALPTRGLERDTPFSLVARKHLRNARIRSLHQPRLERVLELDCEQRDAAGQHYGVMVIVEAMGRRSNLVLVGEDGAILDAARRSPPSRNPRRPVLPHRRYEPPPPQDRELPEQLSVDRIVQLARGRSGALAPFLAATLAGLSPQAARELAFRATGALETPIASVDWPALLRAIHEFFTMIWAPSLALEDGQPIAYAPYLLTHMEAQGAELQPFESISATMDAFFARLPRGTRGDPLAAERRALLAPLDRALHTVSRRIASLEQQLESGQTQRDPLRTAGELILAYQSELPLGSTSLSADDTAIELDPKLTAVENAQSYFARYRKAREAAERVPALLEAARNQAAHVADLRALVDVADQMDAIRALRSEVAAATREKQTPARAKPAPARASYRRVSIEAGWEALVGTSAVGNASVTFDQARPDDLWLHARNIPGAHVILRGPSNDPPANILERAAALAAWHSAARTSGSVEVDIAPKRHVKKIPNAPPGLVRYSNERTIRVAPKAGPG